MHVDTNCRFIVAYQQVLGAGGTLVALALVLPALTLRFDCGPGA